MTDRTYRVTKRSRFGGKIYEIGEEVTLPAEDGDAITALDPIDDDATDTAGDAKPKTRKTKAAASTDTE